MKSGGDFKRVEIHAKQMIENKHQAGEVERECTKTQLKELYKWDELGPQV